MSPRPNGVVSHRKFGNENLCTKWTQTWTQVRSKFCSLSGQTKENNSEKNLYSLPLGCQKMKKTFAREFELDQSECNFTHVSARTRKYFFLLKII